MKKNVLSFIVLCIAVVMPVNAQSEKIKILESAFVQGGETSLEAFGVSKPENMLVFNSKTNTKYSRTTFMKFKIPEGMNCLNSVRISLQIVVFKNKDFPDSKFDLDVQAVPEGKWSSQSITFNNAPKLGDVLGSAQLDQSLDGKMGRVEIKLKEETVNKLIKESKNGILTIALANNVFSRISAAIGKILF